MNCYRSVVAALKKCSSSSQSKKKERRRSRKDLEDEIERVEPLQLKNLPKSGENSKRGNGKRVNFPDSGHASEEMTDTSSEKNNKDDHGRGSPEYRRPESVDSTDTPSRSGFQIVVTSSLDSSKTVVHNPKKPEENYLSYISKVIKIQCFIRGYLSRKRRAMAAVLQDSTSRFNLPEIKTNHSINVEEIKAELRDEIHDSRQQALAMSKAMKYRTMGTGGSGDSSVSSSSYTTDDVGFGRQPKLLPKREIGSNVFYEGYWRDTIKWGKGKITWPNGSCYEGAWKHDQAHGKGIYTSEFGEAYFSDSVADSTMKHIESVTSYEGAFKHHFKHGDGVEKYADGRKYEGKFKHGKRHGFGVLTFLDGSKYIGQFKSGIRQGIGTLETFDGMKYEGEFFHEKFHGKGKLTKAGGQIYVGQFKEGVFDGEGQYSAEGKIYKGVWVDGKREGEFSVVNRKGKTKKVVYQEDKRAKK